MKSGLFELGEYPPFYITIFCSFQELLLMISSPISVVFIIHSKLCAPDNSILFAELLSIALFMSGVATLLQVVFGTRLPIVQGSAHSFLAPVVAMMASPKWRCPDVTSTEVGSQTIENSTSSIEIDLDLDHLWKPRLMELSGGLAVAACAQILLGCSGSIGFLMNYIGPMTIIPTVALIGLSLVPAATNPSSQQWGIAIMVIGLVVVFSQMLGKVQFPLPVHNKEKGWHKVYYPIFRLFPHVLALGVGWLLCYILTETDVFPSDPGAGGYKARTDTKLDVISKAKWFFWPYPGRWGTPTISAGVFVSILATTIASTIESVGDYYATASICEVPPPPKHAINRGIAMEGLSSVFSGLLGAGHATTSYSGVIGFIGITGVRSRIVWILLGFLLVLCGVIGKIGAALSIVPDPIIGGLTVTLLGMVISVALTNIKHIDTSSPRNLLILAIAIMLGMMVPGWIKQNPGVINSGHEELDQLFTVLLSTANFIGGIIGFSLDNIVPGTKEERGLFSLRADSSSDDALANDNAKEVQSAYDIPYISKGLRRIKCCTYVPFLPSYLNRPICKRCCKCCKRNNPDKHNVLQYDPPATNSQSTSNQKEYETTGHGIQENTHL